MPPLQLTVPKIACSACVSTITQAVTAVDPTAKVAADTQSKLVSIETQQPEALIRETLTAAGYPVV